MTIQKRKMRKKTMRKKRSTMERSPNQSWSQEAAGAWLETFVSSQGIVKRKRKTKRTRKEMICAGRTATRTARCSIKRRAQTKMRRTSPR